MLATPSFWKTKNLVAKSLLPFAFLYLIGQKTHYFIRSKRVRKLPQKVICVGNNIAGGSGKTPTAIAISKLLSDTAFICKGYMDEMQLLAKVRPTYTTPDEAKESILIYDDGINNPLIHKDIKLLVVDKNYLFGNNYLLPAGPLRHKIPSINAIIAIGGYIDELKDYTQITAKITPDYSGIDKSLKYIAFSALGNNEKFFAMLARDGFRLDRTIAFPDHHKYTSEDSHDLLGYNLPLLCTEKDIVKLPVDKRFTAVPITLSFDEPDKLLAILTPNVSDAAHLHGYAQEAVEQPLPQQEHQILLPALENPFFRECESDHHYLAGSYLDCLYANIHELGIKTVVHRQVTTVH
jgi:tetraacyldisaccharide 4'-kinase